MRSIISGAYSLFFDLGHAIHTNDESIFKYLLNEKTANKLTKGGFSPLHLSLICGANKFSYELLEHKANPNHQFKNDRTDKEVSLLQDIVDLEKIPQAKLLIYYGAIASGVRVKPESLKEIQTAYDIYKSKIAPYKDKKTIEAYENLAQTWQEISEQEQDPLLKQCYRHKAQAYIDKLNKLDSSAPENLILINEMKYKKI